MKLFNLFSLLENFDGDLPNGFYHGLKESMTLEFFFKKETILQIGDRSNYFYYLAKGNAWGVNEENIMTWFCEENEIILFDNSLVDKCKSSYQIVIGKDSMLYKIEREKLYTLAKQNIIECLLRKIENANTLYFLKLHANMKSYPLKPRVILMYEKHPNFILKAPLSIISSFLGGSQSKICTIRKSLY